MAVLLYGVGLLAVVAGAVMIGFGIPVNEFSFGNTLIVSGVTAIVGGFVVFGLGAAVSRLQRISEMMEARTPIRAGGRPLDMFESEPPRPPMQGRPPFPSRSKAPAPAPAMAAAAAAAVGVAATAPFAEASTTEPSPDLAPPVHPEAAPDAAPTLPNPDEPLASTAEEPSALPPETFVPPQSSFVDAPFAPPPFLDEPVEVQTKPDEEVARDDDWRHPPLPEPKPAREETTSFFDAMWPAETKSSRSLPPVPAAASAPPEEPEPLPDLPEELPDLPERLREGKIEPPPFESAPAPFFEAAAPEPEPEPEPEPAFEPEPVKPAILKSGIVDGMGYTLYVDGSIEAELPTGTLHFASINELRAHLERNS